MNTTSFNPEWVKTVSRDEFIAHGKKKSRGQISDAELGNYYDSVKANEASVNAEAEKTKPVANATGGNDKQAAANAGASNTAGGAGVAKSQ